MEEGCKTAEGGSSQRKMGAEYVVEEGELIDSGSGAIAEGEQCPDKSTQQSSVFDNNVADMDTEGKNFWIMKRNHLVLKSLKWQTWKKL
jgi:hypothetical protein